MSLYRQGAIFYVQKQGQKLQELETKDKKVSTQYKEYRKEDDTWKGILIYLMSDCMKNSTSLLARAHLTERELTQLVTKYNKCQRTDYTVYKEDKPWTKVVIGGAVGMTYSTPKTTYHMAMYSYMEKR